MDDARSGLDGAAAAIAALHDLLAGPRRTLVLVGNNAEMRSGSGSFASVGVLDTESGQLDLGPFAAAGELTLPAPAPAMDPDLAAALGVGRAEP